MEYIAYILAAFIGLSLGVIGGGGSILTVPVLVYIMGFGVVLSTAYSLFIVGIVALFGAFDKFRKNEVNLKAAFIFGLPSLLSVYATRRFLVPNIPDELFSIAGFLISKELALMIFFAFIMVLAAFSMLRSARKTEIENDIRKKLNYPLIIVEGMVVGLVTGLIGAGGGFLIVPALVLLVGLSMRVAIGTSLAIIAMKSLFGFVGDLQVGLAIDWSFLLSFSAIAIGGILVGSYISKYISGKNLKKIFAWFIILMAIVIVIKEFNII